MRIEYDIKLGFKDVMIRPKRSTLKSRSEVSLERDFKFLHSPFSWTGIPIIAANMDTVGTFEMAKALSKKQKILNNLFRFGFSAATTSTPTPTSTTTSAPTPTPDFFKMKRPYFFVGNLKNGQNILERTVGLEKTVLLNRFFSRKKLKKLRETFRTTLVDVIKLISE